MSQLITHALGTRARNPRSMHTCDGCVNKAAAAGAIAVLGGATLLGSGPLTDKYQEFETALIQAWKDVSRPYFESGVFRLNGSDDGFAAANMIAINALTVQWADIMCSRMSPVDRAGWISGAQRALQMLTVAGTMGFHQETNPGMYGDERGEQVMEDVLDGPIPKEILVNIADAWDVHFQGGAEAPVPSDFIGSNDTTDAPLDRISDLVAQMRGAGPNSPAATLPPELVSNILRVVTRDIREGDHAGQFQQAKELHGLIKQVFPDPSSPQRRDLDAQFNKLERVYRALMDDAAPEAQEPSASSYTPINVGHDPMVEAAGIVDLEFNHKPTPEEVAAAVYKQIKTAHPQAKITEEQILGALRGQENKAVRVVRVGRKDL